MKGAADWAVRLALSDATATAALRLRAGVDVLVQGAELWVRGGAFDDETETALRKLPCTARYAVQVDGALLAWGERIPCGSLPEGTWTPIAEWVRPRPQDAARPGEPSRRVTPRLVRGSTEREAAILVAGSVAFAAWAETAPAVRLKPLVFALCEDGRVLVRGKPLPSIAGTRFAEEGGIAVPCGWAFQPPIDAAVLREALGLAHGDLALFSEDGSWERIPREALVRASRSAVRMSTVRPDA